jgi:plastocyanin
MLKVPAAAVLTTGIIGLAALAMACGGASQGASASGQSTDNATQPAQAAVVQVATPTAAPALAATPTTAPAAAPTTAAAPTEQPAPVPTANTAPPPPAPSTLTMDMRDNLFAIPQMRVVAGTPITMTVHNEGKNMHNWDLQGVAKTALQKGGEYQVVTFTVQPGTYAFICDVHPKEMVGTLIAE